MALVTVIAEGADESEEGEILVNGEGKIKLVGWNAVGMKTKKDY